VDGVAGRIAALNIPGSNNDVASWGSPLSADALDYPSQPQEQANRAQANSAWLEQAFALATEHDAAGVVLMFQADMWDPTAALSAYDALVQQIGSLAATFGKPVLLLEGDSHVFRRSRRVALLRHCDLAVARHGRILRNNSDALNPEARCRVARPWLGGSKSRNRLSGTPTWPVLLSRSPAVRKGEDYPWHPSLSQEPARELAWPPRWPSGELATGRCDDAQS